MKKIALFFVALGIGQIQADQGQTVWKRFVIKARSTMKQTQAKARTFWSPRKTKIAAGLVTVAGGTGIISFGYYLLNRKPIIHNLLSHDSIADLSQTSVETPPKNGALPRNDGSLKDEDTIKVNGGVDRQDADDDMFTVDGNTMVTKPAEDESFEQDQNTNNDISTRKEASKESGSKFGNMWQKAKNKLSIKKRDPKKMKQNNGGLKGNANKPVPSNYDKKLDEIKNEELTQSLIETLKESGIETQKNSVFVTLPEVNDNNSMTVHIDDKLPAIGNELSKWVLTVNRGDSVIIKTHNNIKLADIDWNDAESYQPILRDYQSEETLQFARDIHKTNSVEQSSRNGITNFQFEKGVFYYDNDLSQQAPKDLEDHWRVLKKIEQDGQESFIVQVSELSGMSYKQFRRSPYIGVIELFIQENPEMGAAMQRSPNPIKITVQYHTGDIQCPGELLWKKEYTLSKS